MAVSDGYLDYILAELECVGGILSKRMFGGLGIYSHSIFFAIIADDTLRFKVDDTNRGDYERAGMKPFKPYKDKAEVMNYYEVPVEVLEDNERLRSWAERSIEVAKAAKQRKPAKRRSKG